MRNLNRFNLFIAALMFSFASYAGDIEVSGGWTRATAFSLLSVAISQAVFADDDGGQLPEITVTASQIKQPDALIAKSINSNDSASLLADEPGVSLYTNGGASSLPVIHGLNDDRIKVLVDGMSITSACANHMNPATSYISATSVSSTAVIAGLTPVSMGGDSIAGTISLESALPIFAGNGEELPKEGNISTSYRSVNSGSTLSARHPLQAVI